jgi:hypothetical protein
MFSEFAKVSGHRFAFGRMDGYSDALHKDWILP